MSVDPIIRLRRACLGLAAGLLAAAAMPISATAGFPAQLHIADGWLRGSTQQQVLSFKGIPYAAAPIHDLRWRPPQAVTPWDGVRDALGFGADCPQTDVPGDVAILQTVPAEDCLFLNVWRPAQAVRKLPVMVWIHGGGFVNGGSSAPIYSGAPLAAKGVLVVSLNYRLGRLGFFAFPALSAEHPTELKANYGLMDQIAALQWVKRNIAAFGGDPGNVTVVGESAGGMSIHALLASSQARGLFRRAIIQSGAGRGEALGPERLLNQDQPNQPSAESVGVIFAHKMGIEGGDAQALAQLRALPADKIVDGLNMNSYALMLLMHQRPSYAGPTIDGRLIAETPDRAYIAGRAQKLPVLIGTTSGDLSLAFVHSKPAALALLAPYADQAATLYDPNGQASAAQLAAQIGADRYMVEPARFIARTLAGQGLPVYEYRFGYISAAQHAPAGFGAPHASDVPFTLDTVRLRYGADASTTDLAVAGLASDYWVNFARSGDPNAAGLPAWPRYQASTDQVLQFQPDGNASAGRDPWAARLDLATKVATNDQH